jgi:hypothetical protein
LSPRSARIHSDKPSALLTGLHTETNTRAARQAFRGSGRIKGEEVYMGVPAGNRISGRLFHVEAPRAMQGSCAVDGIGKKGTRGQFSDFFS